MTRGAREVSVMR